MIYINSYGGRSVHSDEKMADKIKNLKNIHFQ